MKKHLVVVCGVIYPSPSPTGLCTLGYVNLLADSYDIDVVGISSNGEYHIYLQDNGVRIYALVTSWLKLENTSSKIFSLFMRKLHSSLILFRKLGNLEWFRYKACEKLYTIHNTRSIDTILTVCSPISAHLAGLDFAAKYNTHICAYTVDPYSAKDRKYPIFDGFNDYVNFEKKIYMQFDQVLFSEEIYKYRSDLIEGLTNCSSLPYLLPTIDDKTNIEENYFGDGKIHCVYAGSFYADIRNPKLLLKYFSSIQSENIILDLFSSGCDKLIREYINKSNNIVAHGYVSRDELRKVYASANILIGVGNTLDDFLPSKTFEYISHRKPIVFFNPENKKNDVLNKYEYALQFNEVDNQINGVAILVDFCNRYKNSFAEKSTILKIYNKHTPNEIKSILMKSLA